MRVRDLYGGELIGIVNETDFLGAFIAAAAAGRTV